MQGTRTRRAALLQGALAAVLSGSLVLFAVLATSIGFEAHRRSGVAAVAPSQRGVAISLPDRPEPASGDETASAPAAGTAAPAVVEPVLAPTLESLIAASSATQPAPPDSLVAEAPGDISGGDRLDATPGTPVARDADTDGRPALNARSGDLEPRWATGGIGVDVDEPAGEDLSDSDAEVRRARKDGDDGKKAKKNGRKDKRGHKGTKAEPAKAHGGNGRSGGSGKKGGSGSAAGASSGRPGGKPSKPPKPSGGGSKPAPNPSSSGSGRPQPRGSEKPSAGNGGGQGESMGGDESSSRPAKSKKAKKKKG